MLDSSSAVAMLDVDSSSSDVESVRLGLFASGEDSPDVVGEESGLSAVWSGGRDSEVLPLVRLEGSPGSNVAYG